MALMLWKDKDALHKAHQKGVCSWHCRKEVRDTHQLGDIC